MWREVMTRHCVEEAMAEFPTPTLSKASLESDSTAWLRWGGPMTCNIWLETETGVSP